MEEIYMNVDHVKPSSSRPSTIQTGPRRSEGSFYRAASLVLGLLSVLLLAGLIGLGVLYHCAKHGSAVDLSILNANLTEERDLLSASLMETTEKKDLLSASLMEMTEKKDLLNASLMEMTEKKDLLSASLMEMTEARDLLNASLIKMTEERNRLHTLSTRKKTCPAGWRMFSCVCYFVSTERKSWENARQDCRDKGAELVIIDSLEEQKFLSSLETSVWIGLNDRDKEGTWKWTDGTPMITSYWSATQPDNWNEEDCVHINNYRTVDNWNDLSCRTSLQWICEELA